MRDIYEKGKKKEFPPSFSGERNDHNRAACHGAGRDRSREASRRLGNEPFSRQSPDSMEPDKALLNFRFPLFRSFS